MTNEAKKRSTYAPRGKEFKVEEENYLIIKIGSTYYLLKEKMFYPRGEEKIYTTSSRIANFYQGTEEQIMKEAEQGNLKGFSTKRKALDSILGE